MVLFPFDISGLRAAVSDDCLISYDASHTFGLIAGGRFQAPLLEGADFLQGSTHKSMFGPQKAIIIGAGARSANFFANISNNITPLLVSNAHLHHIAALGAALEEMTVFGKAYADQLILNSTTLAKIISKKIDVFSYNGTFTHTHQIWLVIGNDESAQNAMRTLEKIGIHSNAIRVPFTEHCGLRLGLSEVTRLGMKETEIATIGEIIIDAILKRKNLKSLRKDVMHLANSFKRIQYTFENMGER